MADGPAKEGLSRRDFLRVGAISSVVSLGLGFFSKVVKKEGWVGKPIESLLDVFSDENKIDVFLGVTTPLLIGCAKKEAGSLSSEFQENTMYRSLAEILDEGIRQYGEKVFYKLNLQYLTDVRFREILMSKSEILISQGRNIETQDVIEWAGENTGQDVKTAEHVQTFLTKAKEAVYTNDLGIPPADKNYESAMQLLDLEEGSGIVERARQYSNNKSDQRSFVLREIAQVNALIKASYETKGERVSTSEILTYFLKKNSGDLGLSIYDTAIFLKIYARNSLSSLAFIASKNTPEKYQELCDRFLMLKDEFSVVGNDFGLCVAQQTESLDNENKDLSLVNRIGQAYHVWYATALLMFMERTALKSCVIGTQLVELKGAQGRLKTASDFKFLMGLKEVDELVRKFI